jgi:hypothetical protein
MIHATRSTLARSEAKGERRADANACIVSTIVIKL